MSHHHHHHKHSLKNDFYFLIGMLFVAGSIYLFINSPAKTQNTVKIGDTKITVDIASTEAERQQGLSGRSELKEGEGMLFIFPTTGVYTFWMKEMNFPIDIVWIDKDKRIIGVERGVSPSTYPEAFLPPGPVKYVLELPSGYAERNGIDIGEVVYFDA